MNAEATENKGTETFDRAEPVDKSALLTAIKTELKSAREELSRASRCSYLDWLLGGFICMKIIKSRARKAGERLEKAKEAAADYEKNCATTGKHLPPEFFDPAALDAEELPLDGIAVDMDMQSAISDLIRQIKAAEEKLAGI